MHKAILVFVALQIGRHKARTVCFDVGQLLKFHLHPCDILPRFCLHQLLDVIVQIPGSHFCVPTDYGLEDGIVDEDVLILRLNHVISLCPQTSHMPIDIDCLLVLHPLQHRVNDNEASCPANSSRTVNNHWTRILRSESTTASQELQEWCWMVRNSMIWPCCELQLLNLSPLTTTLLAHLESADAVRGQFLGFRDGHCELPISLTAPRWPVLVTLDPRTLLQASHHDNGGSAQFPAHSPEISTSILRKIMRQPSARQAFSKLRILIL